MNQQKILFIRQELQKKTKINSEIQLEELKHFAKQQHVRFKADYTKYEIFKAICEKEKALHEFDKKYSHRFKVSDTYLKKIYDISKKNIHSLELMNVLPVSEKSTLKNITGESYTSRLYPITVLDIDPIYIKEQVQLLQSKELKIRIELSNENEISLIEKQLKKVFHLDTKTSNVYKNSDGSYYCYYTGLLHRQYDHVAKVKKDI